MNLNVLAISPDELRVLVDDSVKYLGETIASERFSGDDALDYTSGCIDILMTMRDIAYHSEWPTKMREWLNSVFTAEISSDIHPSNLATYMAIPPVWDDYIVHRDED